MGFLSGLSGLDDAKKASEAQEKGFQESIGTFQNADAQQRQDYAPYTGLGRTGVNNLMAVYGDGEPNYDTFRNSPGYTFMFNEGRRAVDNSGAARGMNLSGAQLKALTKYGQGAADTGFNNWFNRQMALTNTGQNATNSMTSLGANYANQIGAAQQGVGAARASGYMAKANLYNDQWTSIRNSGQRIGEAWASPGLAMGGG